ncbi:hypothetical protein [uncultured Treponema sp.]|uniref:hypothetical protein n=1 Tax=uncultured Treponema sp. TaxID=162155 RepID=UPI0025D2FA0C|nr:hypothetical protein [uncultured Treponema sp.]
MKKNYIVEFLRFFFAVFIILYHYYSYVLKGSVSPKLFMHAYVGDEFFFMISGFFLANSIIKKLNVLPTENSTVVAGGGTC